MILLTAALLVAGAVAFTLLVRARDLPEPGPVSPVQHLEERKARIYEGLRDLQFEYRVGKLSDGDYQNTKLGLQKELARIMAEIDAILKKTLPARAAATTVPAAPSPTPPVSSHCPHCGAQFQQALKFCGECGQPMRRDPA